uniref:Uncharacterized protein n=1 Tax=Skeletonema marinoi TaxID=267567 RepID=A0A7S2LJ34_9STRA|mmetsp:Transcript_25967/g.44120  ORF Transcript_25967/g.44120 Transcript_25967/m.44120 type:complete len:695 (+) Transcript_25967:110-2194(+)
MSKDTGCFNAVVFNDGEIVSRQRKNTTLEGCFALSECASNCDEFTADYHPADEFLRPLGDEHPQHKKDAGIDDEEGDEGEEALFDFSADFDGAFGLMERDEAGTSSMGMTKIQTTSPSRTVAAPSNYSSPRSVMSRKVYDSSPQSIITVGDDASQVMGLTSLNNNTTRKSISGKGYSVGDEANLMDFSVDISKEDAAFEANSLEVGDAAFILRSGGKWTYAIIIDKAMVPDGQYALRFEVGADNSRKTFMEAQWGKYVRVIKATNSTAAESNAATVMTTDPDLSYYESDSDEETLNDNDDVHADENVNHDAANAAAAAEDTKLARPKGILRNKSGNALDRYLKSKVIERKRSEGNAGYSVQFVQFNTMDDAESRTSDAKQASGSEEEGKEDSIFEEVVEEEDKPDPADLFPAREITFTTPTESEAVQVGAELSGIDNETSEVPKDKNASSETKKIDETTPSDDDKEDVVMQTLTSCQKGIELFNIADIASSPIRLDLDTITPALECPSTPLENGESWDVGQILLNLAQPIFDLNNIASVTQPSTDASVPENDVVEESLTIECELQSKDDVKVHVTPLPSAALRAENEAERKVDDKICDARTTLLPTADAIQSANDLSLLKRDALNIHKRKGVQQSAMRSVPTLNRRDRSFKNKMVANTISRVRSLKKGGKVDLDALNVTSDTIDSYEVHPEKEF